MIFESKQVLVTVKTYPNPSKKYRETVCVAGIDLETGQWIRLYPIPFRDLDEYQQFKKYSVIKIIAEKARDDRRPESFKVDSSSIQILEHLDTKNGWKRRKELILPTKSESFCDILTECASQGKSLGMFKPQNVEFLYKKAKPKDIPEREDCYSKLDLFYSRKKPIDPLPVDFRYSFSCTNTPSCPGHDLLIIDWELFQSYRSWRWKYRKESVLLEKIKERWFDKMCTENYDTYFYVGNTKRFKKTFMILGVFYPPK